MKSDTQPTEPPRHPIGFLFYQGLQLTEVRLTHIGDFLSLLIQILISSQNTLIGIPGIMSDQISGHPMAQSS